MVERRNEYRGKSDSPMTDRLLAPPYADPQLAAALANSSRRPVTSNGRLFFYLAVVASVVGSTFTSNPLLSAAGVLILAFLIALFWRPGEPPILAWTVLFPWIQVVTAVVQADVAGTAVSSLSLRNHAEDAIWLSIIGIAVLATGLRLGSRSVEVVDPKVVDAQLRAVSLARLFALYLAFAVLAALVATFQAFLPSLAQALARLVNLKWAFFFLLGYLTLRRRRDRQYFVIAVLIELVSGIGFFAEFRLVFFISILVILSVQFRLTWKNITMAGLGTIAMVLMALAWTHVKPQYREYLNQGTNRQVSLVSPTERVGSFVSLTTEVSPEDLEDAVNPLLNRIAYVDYFAAAIDYVPARRPHERGNLLMQAVLHVLHPRFLYPDKAPLSDSEITTMYTGVSVAGEEQGTSISIGFMGESYIDFGRYVMFVPIFLVGIMWGMAYARFVHYPIRGIGYAFGIAMLLHANEFVGMSGPKLLGGTITDFVILALFLRYVMPWLLAWLQPSIRVRST